MREYIHTYIHYAYIHDTCTGLANGDQGLQDNGLRTLVYTVHKPISQIRSRAKSSIKDGYTHEKRDVGLNESHTGGLYVGHVDMFQNWGKSALTKNYLYFLFKLNSYLVYL